MTSFDSTQLAKFLSTAVEAARRGAEELESWRARFTFKEKSRADLVTDADHASQRVVKETLLAAFPDHAFLGEEGGGMISTGFPANHAAHARNLDAWAKVIAHAQTLRRTGSTALNLAYVAAGRFDGYWAYDNFAWDVLAGAVLVAEAGGHLTTAAGTAFDPFRPDIIATNGRFHADLLAVLSGGAPA